MSQIIALQIPLTMNDYDYEFFISKVSASKRQQINKYRQKKDAYRSLLGEALVRAAICKNHNLSNENIHFTINQYGKPSLLGYQPFCFNISHSGEWIVMIWGRDSVGIDIEKIKPIDDVNITKRFFSSVEYEDLLSKTELERIDYFYDLWTLKESYIKAIGTGLSTPLNSFTIRILPEVTISLSQGEQKYYFRRFDISPLYKLSVCSCSNQIPEEIVYYHIDVLYRYLT